MSVDSDQRRRSECDRPRAIAECLEALPVAARAERLAALNRQFQLELPPALAGHITLADIRVGRAVLLVPSSAWASRVRLLQQPLLEILHALGRQASSIEVNVVQPERIPDAPAGRKTLTRTAAAHLRSAAASTSDPELRARFLALATLADEPSA